MSDVGDGSMPERMRTGIPGFDEGGGGGLPRGRVTAGCGRTAYGKLQNRRALLAALGVDEIPR